MTASKEAGNILFSFTHHLTDVIEKDILDKQTYLGEPERFFYTILHKLRNILDATSLLVTNLDEKPHYYDSVFLLLRTCLLDVVNLYYIMNLDKNIATQQERIRSIMFDHINSIWICAKDDDERKLAIQTFPDWFEDGKLKKGIPKISIIAMHNGIKIPSFKNETRTAIDLYNIFSKVEHNGILSFNLLHIHYQNEGALKGKYKVYLSIKTIMKAILLLIRYAWNIPQTDKRFLELVGLSNRLIIDYDYQ